MEIKNSEGVSLFTQDVTAFTDGVGYELWKVFDPTSPSCLRRFNRECDFFENSQDIPYVPKHFLIDKENYKLARPLVRGDSLNAFRNSLDIKSTTKFLLQWAKSLQGMHNKGMIYCDVKPANAILNDGGKDITLIDFDGVEKVPAGKDFVPGMCRGTFPYFAPERLMRDQSFTTYSSDTFALGMLAHYVLKGASEPYSQGFTPSSTQSFELRNWEKEVTGNILNKDTKPLKSGSRDLDAIVRECTHRSYSKRIKDQDLIDSLSSIYTKLD